jgi:hypothetical protein
VAQEGITSGTSTRVTLNGGLGAVSTPFSATTANGTLSGTALFVDYGGSVYSIVGYAPEARWSRIRAWSSTRAELPAAD